MNKKILTIAIALLLVTIVAAPVTAAPSTVGLYQKSTGIFFLKNSNSGGAADIVFQYGWGGDDLVPVVGQWV